MDKELFVTTVTCVSGCPEDVYPEFGCITDDWKSTEKELEDIIESYGNEEFFVISTPLHSKEGLFTLLQGKLVEYNELIERDE